MMCIPQNLLVPPDIKTPVFKLLNKENKCCVITDKILIIERLSYLTLVFIFFKLVYTQSTSRIGFWQRESSRG